MSLFEKMEVSNKLDREMSLARVTYHYGAHKLQTIHFIKGCGDRTRGRILTSVPMSVNTSCITFFDPFHKTMENTLCVWLKDTTQGGEYTDMQKTQQSMITLFSLSLHLCCGSTLFKHSDNFQPET